MINRTIAKSPAAKDCLKILEAGLAALDPAVAVTQTLRRQGNTLHIGEREISIAKRRIFVIGAGKASASLAAGVETVLGNAITDGLVIDTQPRKLKRIKILVGDHPISSAKNVTFTKKIISLTETLGVSDIVICVFSGGGSALFTDPQIPLPDYQALMKELLRSGATIQELNTIRKHIDGVKGGRFAEKLFPATVITLLVSDVVGNNLGVIASGPTVLDSTTAKDARRILSDYGLNQVKLTETPKETSTFKKVENLLILDSTNALTAMQTAAEALGLRAITLKDLHGEARDAGIKMLAKLDKKMAVIGAGETTVTVKGHGKGGRNQELVLGSVETLASLKNTALASMSSDGRDNSDYAGALADETTLKRAKQLKLTPALFLQDNNSYMFWKKINSAIKTGKTGTNISDIMVAVRL